ncbi:hypothetical protein COOONC_00570 [Cooperia oncophora]
MLNLYLDRAYRGSVRSVSTPGPARISKRATSSVSDESVVTSRAMSTPNKPITDLTFADLNLSAIQGDAIGNLRKSGRSRIGSRKEMGNIEEEE